MSILKEGILEKVPIDFKTDNVHYLPHRAVVKEDRETTKVRNVFDVSAKYKNELSLNEVFGPRSLFVTTYI